MLRMHIKNHDKAKRYMVKLAYGSLNQTFFIPPGVAGYTSKENTGDDRCYHFSRLDNSIGPIVGKCKGSISDGADEKPFEFEGEQGLDNEDLVIISGK